VTAPIPATIATGRGSGAARATTAAPTLGVPPAPPLPEDLELLLRGLRLPHIRRHAPEVLATERRNGGNPPRSSRLCAGRTW